MITLLCLYWILDHLLKVNLEHRWDGSPALPYFSAGELGVEEERFSFMSGVWMLDGSRYFVGKGPYKALVVVYHGIGAGRNAYMKIIAGFAKAGFLVYAFDYTGCMRSQGNTSYGLSHVYKDMQCFYRFLDSDQKAKGLARYSWGHSWGGHAALMSSDPSFHVEKIVSLAGFPDEGKNYGGTVKFLQKPPFPFLLKARRRIHEGVGVDSAFDLLDKTNAKVLYVQGLKDTLVPYEFSGKLLKERYENDSRFTFLFLADRDHYLDCSQQTADYIQGLLKAGITDVGAPQTLTMDIAKTTEEDERIHKATFDFFLL